MTTLPTPTTIAILVGILGFATIVAIAFLTYKWKVSRDARAAAKASLLPTSASTLNLHLDLAHHHDRPASSGTLMSPTKQKHKRKASGSPLKAKKRAEMGTNQSTISFPASTRRFVIRRGLAVRVPSLLSLSSSFHHSHRSQAVHGNDGEPRPSKRERSTRGTLPARMSSVRSDVEADADADADAVSGSGWSWSNRGAPSWLWSASRPASTSVAEEPLSPPSDVYYRDARSEQAAGKARVTVEATEREGRGRGKGGGEGGRRLTSRRYNNPEMGLVIEEGIVNAVTQAGACASPAMTGTNKHQIEPIRSSRGPEMAEVVRDVRRMTSPKTPTFPSTPLMAGTPSMPGSPRTPKSPGWGEAAPGLGRMEGNMEAGMDSPTRALLLKSRYNVG